MYTILQLQRARLVPLTYSVLCKVRGSKVAYRSYVVKNVLNCAASYSTDRSIQASQPEYYASKHFWRVHELVSQGQYVEALETWDKQKASGETDRYMYTPLMRLASLLKSAEAAKALEADMARQNWEMDSKCALHYLAALTADGCKTEAFEYLCQSPLKDQPQFLASVARRFHEQGEPELALKVCQLGSSSEVLAVQLELLGQLQNVSEMTELMDRHYGGITKAPVEVQLGMAFGLSLANMPMRSLDVVRGLFERGVTIPPKCAALMLEACRKLEDTCTAAKVYRHIWHASCSMEPSRLDFAEASVDFTLYLLRAMNAAIHLQALVLRDLLTLRTQPEGWTMKAFADHGFVAELKQDALLPDQNTYEALMLHSCFQPRSKASADTVIKTCAMTGRPVPASAVTSWTKHCGPLTPKQVKQMLKIVRIHCHHFDISLGAEQISELLSVRYARGSDGQWLKETLECIREIKNLMRADPALVSTHLYNDILAAIARTGDVGALYTTYKEMIVHKMAANTSTYHALLDCCLASGKKHAGKGAAYYTWRNLVKEFPAIELDVGLLNKFIRCSLLCRDCERALFFLEVFDESKVEPNVETFQLLMKACRDGENQEKFQMVVDLAQQCLPQDASELTAFASEVEREWKNARDLALAEQILASQLRSSTLDC